VPVRIAIESAYEGGRIRYTKDGSKPNAESREYTAPFELRESATVHARVFNKEGEPVSPLRSFKYDLADFDKNLATGQKATASAHRNDLKAEHAVDGYVDTGKFWSAAPAPQWWQVDMGSISKVREMRLYTCWDGARYYQYTIDVSLDGNEWETVVDASDNTEKATQDGYRHKLDPVSSRFVRINMLKNSANPSVDIVEFRAYQE